MTSLCLLIINARICIATFKQATIRSKKYKIKFHTRTPALQQRPQVKGTVSLVKIKKPKKPNSATRKVAKVKLTNGLFVTARLPGSGYLCSKYSRVLVNGGRANDLPGVGYTLIRGVMDFVPLTTKRKRRSVYGTRRPEGLSKHVRRVARAIG